MAILFGDNFVGRTVGVASDFPPVRMPPGEEVGDVGMAYDSFAMDVAINTNDIILTAFLPLGVRIVDATLKFAAMGGTGAVDVGFLDPVTLDIAATGELFEAIDVSAAGHEYMLGQAATPSALLEVISESTAAFDPALGGVQIGIKFTTAGTAAAGETIELAVYSVRD